MKINVGDWVHFGMDVGNGLDVGKVVCFPATIHDTAYDCYEHTQCGDDCFGVDCPHYREKEATK